MHRTLQRIYGVIAACLGTILVLGSIYLLNEVLDHTSKTPTGEATIVAVKPKALQKARPKRAAPKRRAQPRSENNLQPELNPSLSGLALDIGEFGLEGDDDLIEKALGNLEDTIFAADMVDVKPQAIEQEEIEYPSYARSKGITGFVTVNILIRKDGSIERTNLLASEPVGVFDQVALQALKTWRFSPAMYQGKEVRVWAKQTIAFNLN